MRLLHAALALLLIGLLPALPLLAAGRTAPPYGAAQLDQLLAPIALYPDGVLSQVLIASTVPLEIVQADRWARRRPGLSGDAAVNAARGEGWQPSVTALVAFPDVLARLSADLDWTQAIGEAFLAQPLDVADRIQGLRRRADAAGSLRSLQTVALRREGSLIFIVPAAPEIVYVPVYNTRIVYGRWAWPAHPPVYWSAPGLRDSGLAFHWGPGIRYRWQPGDSRYFRPQREGVIVHRPGRASSPPPWQYPRDHRHPRGQADQHPRGTWPASTHRPPPGARPRAPEDSGSRWSTAARPGQPLTSPGVHTGLRPGSAGGGGLIERPAPAAAPARPAVSGATRWTRSENRAPVPAVRQAPPQRQLAPPVSPRGPQGLKELPH